MNVKGVSWPWKVVPRFTENDIVFSNALKSLLRTGMDEFKMGSWGSDCLKSLFETKSTYMASMLTRSISVAVLRHMPMISLLSIDLSNELTNNGEVIIDIEWQVNNETFSTQIKESTL